MRKYYTPWIVFFFFYAFPPVAVRALHRPTTKLAALGGQTCQESAPEIMAPENFFHAKTSLDLVRHGKKVNGDACRVQSVLDIRGGSVVGALLHGAVRNPILILCKR